MLAFKALEIGFTVLLVGMLSLAGLIGLAVIVRIVEPKGARALVERLRRSR